MASKVIIIPPDNALKSDVFSYTLPDNDPEVFHDGVLLKYCEKHNLSENNALSMPNIGYVVIYTVGGEYLMYCTYNLSERQLIYIKELFKTEIRTAHLGFIQGDEFSNAGKAKNFDEFMLAYNNLIKKKEGINYVR
ncbi:MAG: hypothetical protein ACLUD7_04190 [Lachnospiraceae bacterium]|jgi:hypothetical protein